MKIICQSCDKEASWLSLHGLCERCQKIPGSLQRVRERAKAKKQAKEATAA